MIDRDCNSRVVRCAGERLPGRPARREIDHLISRGAPGGIVCGAIPDRIVGPIRTIHASKYVVHGRRVCPLCTTAYFDLLHSSPHDNAAPDSEVSS